MGHRSTKPKYSTQVNKDVKAFRLDAIGDGASASVRGAVQRYMARASVHTFNTARLRAQSHEEEMVEVLYGLATDPLIPPVLRRQCAIDVLEQARGKITLQYHDGNTIDPSAPATDGTDRTVGDQIDAARVSAAAMAKIQQWASVPFHQWPEDVRVLIPDEMSVAFSEEPDKAA